MNNATTIFSFLVFERGLNLGIISVPQSNNIFFVGALGRIHQ